MIPVLTAAESARLDAESPIPVSHLMERAGLAVALAAVDMGIRPGDRVTVLAGPGNNGGDGYVAARLLRQRGVDARVEALGTPTTPVAMEAGARAVACHVPVAEVGRPHQVDLVIDAVFGGGSRRGMPSEVAAWMERGGRVLAVDIPTGLDPDTGTIDEIAFDAEVTVTFHTPFPGHIVRRGPDVVGDLRVADIGLVGGDPVLRIVEEADALRPARARNAHKWSAGSVLVVGGSEGMIGAAVMAARAALHFGAGSVGVATPTPSIAQSLAPEVLSYSIDDLPERFDVWVLGPGLGSDRGGLVRSVVESGRAVVLDADAITSLDGRVLEAARRGSGRVLTPHAGEFARLSGGADGTDRDQLERVAGATQSVVLHKGNPTVVTDGSIPWVVRSNGPELATIGTGDVLAGMVAALWARGLDPLTAARSAAYWHGVAGADLAHITTVTADVLARHVGRFAWEHA